MKKIFLVLLIFIIIGGSAFAFDILSYPPPVGSGNVMVDAGIGLTLGDYGTISIPPIFINVEYALPVNVPVSVGGFGAFYRYNYRVSGNSGWQYTFFTFGGRANWHWGLDISWLDLYSGLWIGYRVFSAGWVGGGSGYNAPSYGGFDFGFQAGAHFYFSNTIGLVLESGYPFALKAGVALKFGKQESQSTVSGSKQQSNSRPASNARPGINSTEQTILRLAKENKGIITVSDLALEAGIPMDEAKKQLDDFVAKGFAELRTRKNGSQAYIITDFLEGPLEGF
jgi:predicted transcriptional regulator